MIQFYWPETTGEWLGFTVAAVTIFFGLLLLIMPRLSLRVMRLQTSPEHPDAIAEARGTMAGFYLATGLSCLILAQPFLYMVLGFGWAITAFGRLVSIVVDRGSTRFNWYSFLFEAAMGALPLAFVFGYV